MYTPSQVAARANIHPNTVRKWAGEYAELFSPQTGRRLFTDADVEVFRTIAALRKSGMPPGQVAEHIRNQEQPIVDVALHENAQEAPHAAIEAQSSSLMPYMALQSRMEALERRVDGAQRDAVWAGRIQGMSVGIALAGFVAWLVWSLMNMGT